MHDITREIINIDKNTSSMKDRYKILMDKKEEDLRNQILELEKKYTNETSIRVASPDSVALGAVVVGAAREFSSFPEHKVLHKTNKEVIIA